MANASQIKALIKSHYDNDYTRFDTLSLQLAAHEATLGHSSLALEVKRLVDDSKKNRTVESINSKNVRLYNNTIDELFIYSRPMLDMSEIILSTSNQDKIVKILSEYNNQEKLKKHGLKHRRKILLSGHPGTGKTMSASIIASELHLPLYVIQIDKIITKFMGETGAKLRQIFKMIEMQKGVYFFDEFDSIGTDRSKDNEVGEMRRVLNSFLQFLENDNSDSLIITATNNIALLDRALFRRFDDILYYDIPTKEEILKLLKLRLQAFTVKFDLDGVLAKASGLSHADIVKSCNDAIKEAIINDKKYISRTSLLNNFEIIKESYKKISEA
ncbi:AAA family ATPase [Arcobacter sp. FWKO B]|uniref:AAA family ATPase n=1 Tax=Arcobacter sp. FWKO B TaxID=2593672 RepID=UPI0018A583D4|nr:ATP-binding protein [Arcobacter sp. FWKO B]QOG11836.1 ATP-binding protein [Arcobacter sp. FWKO B]